MALTPRSALQWIDLGLPVATTNTIEKVVPFAGEIKEVWVGASVVATTGTLAIAKGTGAVNILSATNVDLSTSGITAGVGASQTLAGAAAKKVTAGQILKATWTITTAGSFVGGSCMVGIEPSVW